MLRGRHISTSERLLTLTWRCITCLLAALVQTRLALHHSSGQTCEPAEPCFEVCVYVR